MFFRSFKVQNFRSKVRNDYESWFLFYALKTAFISTSQSTRTVGQKFFSISLECEMKDCHNIDKIFNFFKQANSDRVVIELEEQGVYISRS